MRSLYDDIVTALSSHTFSIADVKIREPYDESPKKYPLIVVHEIVNVPQSHATVSGEQRTSLGYQFDIHTAPCVNRSGVVLGRAKAGRILKGELNDLLDSSFSFTRRTVPPQSDVAADVTVTILRGELVADSHGYTYRL